MCHLLTECEHCILYCAIVLSSGRVDDKTVEHWLRAAREAEIIKLLLHKSSRELSDGDTDWHSSLRIWSLQKKTDIHAIVWFERGHPKLLNKTCKIFFWIFGEEKGNNWATSDQLSRLIYILCSHWSQPFDGQWNVLVVDLDRHSSWDGCAAKILGLVGRADAHSMVGWGRGRRICTSVQIRCWNIFTVHLIFTTVQTFKMNKVLNSAAVHCAVCIYWRVHKSLICASFIKNGVLTKLHK